MEAVSKYNAEFTRLSDKVKQNGLNISSHTIAQKAQNIAMKEASDTAKSVVAQANGNTVALENLTKSSRAAAFGMSLAATAGNMLIGVLVSMGIQAAVNAISNWIHAADIAKEEISKSRSEFEQTKTSLKSMNAELGATEEKIRNLESKDTLTFTEQAELEKLKEQNSELEKSIQLEEKKKQATAREVVTDIRKNQKTLDTDFDSSLNTYKATQDKLEKAKAAGYDGTVDLGIYEFNIDQMEDMASEQQAEVLANIDAYEKNRQSIIDKYGTDDISQFTAYDRELYNGISSKLQEAYKTIYSKAEYNKFVIEPVFDEEKFEGLQESLLKYFSGGGSTDLTALENKFGTDVITALKNACDSKGINFDEMVGDMYSNATGSLDKIAPLVAKPNNGYEAEQNSTSKMLRDFILNDLSDEDRTILLNAEIPDETKFKTREDVTEFISSLKNNTDSVVQPSTFSEAWNSIDTTGTDQQISDKQKLLELAEAGKLTEEALENTSLASVFEEAGVSIEEATEKINKMKSSASQLASMKTGISSISGILGEKEENLSSKETRTKGIDPDTLAGMPEDVRAQTKEYEHFVKVLGDGSSKMSDCQDAADKLATAYVNSGNFLSNLTSKNKDYYISVLEEMGVENAAAVVTQALIAKEEEKTTSKINARLASVGFANATDSEITALGNELTALYGSSEALGQYVIRKQLANGSALDSSRSIKNLIALAEQCGYTGEAISLMSSMAKDMKQVEYYTTGKGKNDKNAGNYISSANTEIKGTKKQLKKALNKKADIGTDINAPKNSQNPAAASNTSPAGSGSKQSTQQIDWMARRLDVLSQRIELTKANLENLFSYKRKETNLSRQIKQSIQLTDAYGRAAAKYKKKASQVRLPDNLKAKVRSGKLSDKNMSQLIAEYGEDKAKDIQTYQDYWDKYQTNRKNKITQQTATRDLKKQKYQLTADHAEARISLYEQQKNNAGTAEKKNKYLGKELEQYKRSCQYQISIAKLSKDTTEQARLRAEYEAKITELKKEQLQNTLDENSEQNALLDARLANASTADEKNAILNEQIGVVHSDSQAYAANYSQALSNRSTQSSKAAAAAGKDKSKKLKAADRKKIKQLISQNKPVPDTLINKCSAKTQAQLAEYNASLDWVTDALKARTLDEQESKTKERELNVQQHQNNAERYQSELDLLSARKDNAKSAADKNSILAEEAGTTSQLYAEKIAIAQLEGNITEAIRLQVELENQQNKLNIERHQNLADEHQSQLDLLAAYQNTLTTATEKNQAVEQEKAATSALYAEKIAIAQLEGNMSEALRLQHEQSSQLVALEKKKLDNIVQYYDNLRKINSNQSKNMSNAVNELEARGFVVSNELYASQIALAKERKKGYEDELRQLTEQHGKIQEGTQEWYDSLDSIQACKDGISDCTTNIIEMQKTMRNTDWKIFEKISSSFGLVSSEFDLFINMMSNKKLTDDNTGNFTEEGTATLGAYYSKLLIARNKSEASAAFLKTMEENIASVKEGYTDPAVLEEYEQKKQEHLGYKNEEISIENELIDLMKQKYHAELDCLQDIISKRKELLQAEKDEYDYRRSIEDKTKNISVITRQLTALSGDDSEAARTRIQQLKVSLDEAKQDLQDTEYDRWLSDQQTMLDNLYNDYEVFVDSKLNDTNALLAEAVTYLNNENTGKVMLGTMEKYAKQYQYDYSSNFQNIVTSLGEEGNITTAVNSVCTAVGGISGSIVESLKKMQKNQSAADSIITRANSLKNISTYEDYEKAKEIIRDFDEAPDDVKNIVDSSTKSSIDVFRKQTSSAEAAAKNTERIIASIGTVTLDSRGVIIDALNSYDNLDPISKQLVDKSGFTDIMHQANSSWTDLHNEQLNKQNMVKQVLRETYLANGRTYADMTDEGTRPLSLDELFRKYGLFRDDNHSISESGAALIMNRLTGRTPLPGHATTDMYNYMKSIGFADGGIAGTLQKVPLANGDDGWITIKRGESILTQKQTRDFAALARNLDTLNMTTDLRKNLSGSMSSTIPERGIHSTSIGDISMNIELPNVTNYEDFRRRMQSDPKVESMFKSMLWEKGSLSKYKTRV